MCHVWRRDDKFLQFFGGESSTEETTLKNSEQMRI
jgi:hypothetical protein